MVTLCLILLETMILFTTVAAPLYTLTGGAQGFEFLPTPQHLLFCDFFNSSHPNGYEVVSHCDFHWYFPNG